MSNQDVKTPFKGIYSKTEESTVYAELTQKHPIYGLMFKTMVETGITFKRLTQLTTQELIGHTTLKYTSRLGFEREMPLSKELQQALSLYAYENKKADTDIFFTGKRNNCPLHPATVSQVLIAVSERCGITPYLTTTSLHMTFVYHLIQNDGNCKRAKQYLHATTDKDVYEYLGLPVPDHTRKKDKGLEPETLEITPELVFRLSDATNAAFFKITNALNKKDISLDLYQKMLRYLSEIDHATTEFNGSNPVL